MNCVASQNGGDAPCMKMCNQKGETSMDNTYVMHTNNKHARNTTHVSTCTQLKKRDTVFTDMQPVQTVKEAIVNKV